jgi:hypothetical protein
MKFSQALMLVVVVLAISAGAAFLSEWVVGSAPAGPNEARTAGPKQLTFPTDTVTLKDEVEMHKPGACDFPYVNETGDTLQVGLEKKGCTCERVEMVVLDSQQEAKCGHWPPDVNIRGGAETLLGKEIAWQPLDEDAKVAVPPGAKGFMRLGWSTKEAKPVRLRAAIWCRPKGTNDRTDLTYLGVLANIVPPLQVYPRDIDVPPLTAGKSATVECWCWSATRDQFPLTARLDTENPCIQCKVTPLSARERDELVQRDRDKRRLEEWTHVRYGYHVTIEFHEQLGKSQLDLGAFQQPLILSSGEEGVQNWVSLAWIVRGDVHVLAEKPGDQDLLVLGRFRADEGVTKEYWLQGANPAVQLVLEAWDPAFLKVQFTKDTLPDEAVSRWRLTIIVPPNTASGRFGGKGFVALKILGPTARRIRIPIYGTAYRVR